MLHIIFLFWNVRYSTQDIRTSSVATSIGDWEYNFRWDPLLTDAGHTEEFYDAHHFLFIIVQNIQVV